LYELIEIGGSDAEDFLQGQLTQDVALLSAAASLPAAWCNPKGRVITTVRLLSLEDSIGLVVPASLVDTVIQKLTMYRLRSDVTIDRVSDNWTSTVVIDSDAIDELAEKGLLPPTNAACANHGLIAVDYSDGERFVEIFGPETAFEEVGLAIDARQDDEQRAAMKIRAGIAEINSENTEKYTPHMLNLDKQGAISFNKGCYTGQEVVARTENLGESKRRLMRCRCDGPDISVGDKLSDGERDVGTVVNVSGTEILAVTPVAVHERSLMINGAVAQPF
jgi:folate-binding protein YgfZ